MNKIRVVLLALTVFAVTAVSSCKKDEEVKPANKNSWGNSWGTAYGEKKDLGYWD